MSSREVQDYLSHHLVPQLLESLLTGLLYHRPDDPVSFLQRGLIRIRELGGPESVTWDTFIHLDPVQLRPDPLKTTLRPAVITPSPCLPPVQPAPPTGQTTGPLLPPRTTPAAPVLPPLSPSGPSQTLTASSPTVLQPAPPGPPGITPAPPPVLTPAPSVHIKVKDNTRTRSSEGPSVRTQLSIDSDSDMTESSGLKQEVHILPPQRPRPLIIFLIGGPGSGKGTQAARLARRFGLGAVSLDELLRRQLLDQASPSRKWEVVTEMMSHGELGPQEETICELRRQLLRLPEPRGFVVDGFPRDVHQALSFQDQIGRPDLVMLLLCSNEKLRHRLQQRAARLSLHGDSSRTFSRRLEAFQRNIVSIRRYYTHTHLLTQVDADRHEDVVFADLSSVVKEKLQLKDQSDPAGIPECSSAPSNVTSIDQNLNFL